MCAGLTEEELGAAYIPSAAKRLANSLRGQRPRVCFGHHCIATRLDVRQIRQAEDLHSRGRTHAQVPVQLPTSASHGPYSMVVHCVSADFPADWVLTALADCQQYISSAA